jgi:hypothetical protein
VLTYADVCWRHRPAADAAVESQTFAKKGKKGKKAAAAADGAAAAAAGGGGGRVGGEDAARDAAAAHVRGAAAGVGCGVEGQAVYIC